MDPAHNKGVTIVQQPFSMDFFLKRQADAASAMTYNELAQVLEAKNPKTGKLYTMNNLNVIKMQDVGTAMLEDNIFTTTDYLKNPRTSQRRRSSSPRRCRDGSTAATTQATA